MPKLALRRRNRVKLCEGQLPLFVEKNFDGRAILLGTYDFVTCQRADGSYYGNGGTTCKKGSEAVLPTNRSGKVSQRTKKLCAEQADTILAVTGKPPEASAKAIDDYTAALENAKVRVKEGNLTQEEIDHHILYHEEFDVKQAEFVIIGQEPKTQNNADNQIDHLANSLAQEALIEKGYTPDEASTLRRAVAQADYISAGYKYPWNSFVNVAANTSEQVIAEGSPKLASQDAVLKSYFGGRKLASIEMSNVGAVTVGDGKLVGGKVDPKTSQYGYLKTDRSSVKRDYADKRAAIVKATLEDAAKNGKLRGAMAMPGAGDKYKTFQQEVVDKFWNGKSGAESNIREVTVKDLSSTGGGVKNDVKGHVVNLGNGKYMTSHAMTFVTQGYQSGPKLAELRRESIKAAMASDKGYVPAKPKSTSKPKPQNKTNANAVQRREERNRKNEIKKVEKAIKIAKKERDRNRPGSPGYEKAKNELAELQSKYGGLS